MPSSPLQASRATACALATIFAITVLAGCDDSREAGSGRVAVIDLDRIFDRLGRNSEVQPLLNQKQEALQKRLAALQTKLQQQYAAKLKEVGDEPNDAQKRELAQLGNELSKQLLREQTGANAEFEIFKADQIKKFREEVRPYARDAAAEKGLDVVLTRTDNLFIIPAEVDITEDVLARMSGGRSDKSQKPKSE